jgi:hypothetical protein
MHLESYIRRKPFQKEAQTIKYEIHLQPNLDPGFNNFFHQLHKFVVLPSVNPRKIGMVVEIIDEPYFFQ